VPSTKLTELPQEITGLDALKAKMEYWATQCIRYKDITERFVKRQSKEDLEALLLLAGSNLKVHHDQCDYRLDRIMKLEKENEELEEKVKQLMKPQEKPQEQMEGVQKDPLYEHTKMTSAINTDECLSYSVCNPSDPTE
jgi:predicted nuclease with TOPRIM domain